MWWPRTGAPGSMPLAIISSMRPPAAGSLPGGKNISTWRGMPWLPDTLMPRMPDILKRLLTPPTCETIIGAYPGLMLIDRSGVPEAAGGDPGGGAVAAASVGTAAMAGASAAAGAAEDEERTCTSLWSTTGRMPSGRRL